MPASGYFEGRTETDGKQPDCIRPTEGPWLVFTRLYAHWQDPQGEGIASCPVIVTDADPSIAAIHNRMPLCLAPAQFDVWLNPAEQTPVRLQTVIVETPVTRRMSNPHYDRLMPSNPSFKPGFPGQCFIGEYSHELSYILASEHIYALSQALLCHKQHILCIDTL
ncbi:MAG: SOS response-associated peptidase family protein [Candidatus Thiodiazotropha endolucinida]